MILPIILYGNPILRKKCIDVDINVTPNNNKFNILINNMFETIHKLHGIGLAAPQIGKNINLFIVNIPNKKNFYKKVFINAKILKEYGNKVIFKEGCLSLPNIILPIKRKSKILIEYYDQNFNKKKEIVKGTYARVILHEYDHTKGKLLIDYLSDKEKKYIKKIFINKIKKIL